LIELKPGSRKFGLRTSIAAGAIIACPVAAIAWDVATLTLELAIVTGFSPLNEIKAI